MNGKLGHSREEAFLSVPLRRWRDSFLEEFTDEDRAAGRRLRNRAGTPDVRATSAQLEVVFRPEGEQPVAVVFSTPHLVLRAWTRAGDLARSAELLPPDAAGDERLAVVRDCLEMVGAALFPTREAVTVVGALEARVAALELLVSEFQETPELLFRWRGQPEVVQAESRVRDFYAPGPELEQVITDPRARAARVPDEVLGRLGPSRIWIGEARLEEALAPLYAVLGEYFDPGE